MGKNKRNNKNKQQQTSPQQQNATASATTTTSAAGSSTNSNNNSNAIRIPKIPGKERIILNHLAERACKILWKPPTIENEEWKHYVEVYALLQTIMKHEKPLHRYAFPPEQSNDMDKKRLAKMDAFNEWARAGGVQSDAVEIAIFPGYGLGLRATRDIEADEEVLSVPRPLMFSEEHLSESDQNLFNFCPQMSNLNLAYALVIEKMRGTSSSWYPYINTLPPRYNTVLYFTAEQMQRLRGTSVFISAVKQCRYVARQYMHMYKYAYMQPNHAINGMFSNHGLCYELYRWAVSTVMTRQNVVPAESQPEPISALIPFWEMANNRNGKITSFYNAETRLMSCAAQEACKAGEQFFIYYGDRSIADSLVHGGFVDPNNAKNYMEIRLGQSTSDALSGQRVRLLAQLRIKTLRVLPSPEFISGELLAFVRIFNMSSDQLDHWCSNVERAVDLLHIDCALETDLETRTWQFLYNRFKLLIGVLEATLPEADEVQQLEALQLQHNDVEHEDQPDSKLEIDIMILQYRQLERRILNDALLYVQERLKV